MNFMRGLLAARSHLAFLVGLGLALLIVQGVRRMSGETLLHRTLPRDLGLEVLEWAAERGLHRLRGNASHSH